MYVNVDAVNVYVLTELSLMEEFKMALTISGLNDQLEIRKFLSPSGSVMNAINGISSPDSKQYPH